MKDEKFTYSYSVPTENEKKEIEEIKRRYQNETKEESDFTKLKKLDNKVKKLPSIISLTLGIVGILIFGLGLTMILEWKLLVWGIIVTLVGCIPTVIAYPVYSFIFKLNKEKYGDEIIALSEKLLNEKE